MFHMMSTLHAGTMTTSSGAESGELRPTNCAALKGN
jgi:hypothetical protein